MGSRFRKSVKLPGGGKVNFSKSGIGGSVGTKGFRITKTAVGSTRTTTSIPGSGMSYVHENSGKTSTKKSGLDLYHLILSVALIIIVICSMILLFTSCSSGNGNQRNTPSSASAQSLQPIDSEAKQTGKDYLSGLGYEVVANMDTGVKLEFSITLPELDLQSLEEPPENWEEIHAAALEAANGLRDELGTGVQYIVLHLQDSSGNNLISVLNGRESYNVFAPKEDTNNTAVEESTIVWITDSGSRYHRDPDCSNMNNASPVRLSYAREHGYIACSKCSK